MRLTRFKFGFLFACQLAFSSNLHSQGLYFDPDANTAGNSASTGTSLGGSGVWDTTTANWWNQTSLVAWPNTTADQAIFTGPFVSIPVASTVNVAGPVNANRLSFLRSGYSVTGSTITLGGTIPSIGVNLGESVTIGSQISGTSGLVLNGGGTLRLTNNTNNYTGTTTLSNGSLIITNQAQLGVDASTVVVARQNPYPGSTATIGFGGGSLVLDGTGGGINFTRNLSLQARGPIGDRGAALLSIGNNTIAGNINAAVPNAPAVGMNTRINSVNGNLTFVGGLDAAGTAGTIFTVLGGVNQAGMGNFTIAGPLTGTGTIEKTGSGTLFLTPSSTSGFSGRIRVSGSAAAGQSSVRISSATVGGTSVFGTDNGTNANATIDMNGGVLEVRSDSNQTFNKNTYVRSGSTLFVDRAIGGQAVNGTVTFGDIRGTQGQNPTFSSRNGYGITFGSQSLEASNGDSTFTNNAAGLVRFNGDFWNNTDATASTTRTLTMAGNGNTHITGSIVSTNTSTTSPKVLTKTGNGNLTIQGVATTLDSTVNINGGAVTITDFRSLNNNLGTINIGTGGTAGALIIGTGETATQPGLLTNKVINLAGTTGTPSIYANQTGSNPVVINSNVTNNTGIKTLNLGGTSTANNLIAGAILAPNIATTTQTAATTAGATSITLSSVTGFATGNPLSGVGIAPGTTISAISGNTLTLSTGTTLARSITDTVSVPGALLLKTGPGAWGLGGANTFTGTSVISNGTLRLHANAASSTVLGPTNNITFGTNNSNAGGTLEFVGQAGVDNVQALGGLNSGAGANTIRLTPGVGGTASLTFATQSTGTGGSINVVGASPTNQFRVGTTANGLVGRTNYWEGADFAWQTLGVFRAPVYGVDAATATTDGTLPLTAASNNEITGDVAVPASLSIVTLKMNGARTLTLDPASILTVSSGGVLATSGASTITGGTLALGGQAFVARTNLPGDSLTIDSIISGTNGLTKNGAGTLVLAGANTISGTRTINEGTLRLSGGTANYGAGTNNTLDIRQGATLDLNGSSIGGVTIGQLNNNGTITNTSPTAATFTVGNGNNGGTSFGSINQTAGTIGITKVGTATQNWWGISNYTGVTTIGASNIAVDRLANIGTASGIGAGDATNAATNAASLVFENGGGLDYRGALLDGILTVGATSASTDRLFTMNGATATLSSAVANNNSVNWTNTGDIVFSGAIAARTLTLTGGSQGDNTLTPRITDSSLGVPTSVTKSNTGIWRLNAANNTYSGATTINQGILMATDGQGLSSNSNLVFNGGTLYSQGTINREIGTGPGEMRFAAPPADNARFSGGFLGGDSKLTVNWTTTPEWGVTPQFIAGRDGLILNGSHSGSGSGALGSNALSEVELTGNFSLGDAVGSSVSGLTFTTAANSSSVTAISGSLSGLIVGQTITGTNIPAGSYIVSVNSANSLTINQNASAAGTSANLAVQASNLRTIRVDDNGSTGADYATLSGVISGGSGTGIRKLGGGQLLLSNNNSSYNGETNISQGALAVNSLGNSTIAGNSSVGTTNNANLNSNAITLGNGSTGAGILQYLGAGETSDRKIRLNTTTGNSQIHADGTGPLILLNVANDMVGGAKVLFLRGSSAAGNMITSTLADNGGALGVTVDGGANWILSGTNTHSGVTLSSSGALGIGSDSALGTGILRLSNGNVYAYGSDRTVGNVVQHVTNTTQGFQGDYSLSFGSLVNQAGQTFDAAGVPSTSATNVTTNNNIASGKALTFAGMTANSLTSNRNWAVDGSGLTIINGDITTTTAFGLSITKNGDGILQINGTNSNFNQNATVLDIDRGTLRAGAVDVIPSFAAATPTVAGAVVASTVIPVSSTAGLKVGQLFTGTGVAVGSRIVSIDSPTQFTASLASTIADAATLTFTASAGVTLTPDLDTSDVATFELNGFSQSINGLTATTNGTSIINNSSASAATLTVGNNNAAYNFGNGNNNAITNSGGGALSLTKVGTGTATLGGNNTYDGVTTITGGAATVVNNNALGSTVGNTVINSNGTTTTGGTLSLGVTTPGNGVTTSENFLIQGTGDGGTFATALGGVGGVTSNLNGIVTLNGTQSFRLGSSGAGTITNFGLIQRSGVAGGGIVFNGATGAILNVNQAIDNNLGIITVHAGGTTSLNASLNDIGDALVQNSSTLQITANDALGLNNALTLGQGALINTATGLNNDVATFTFNATSQTIGALNAFANAGTLPNNASATGSRLITSTVAGAKTLTVGNGNGSGGFDGVISNGTGGGTLAFTKVGTGTQSFLGTVANTYTGDTTVNGGTLVLGKNAGVDSIVGSLIIGNGTGGLDIVRLDSSDQISNISSVSFNGSGADAGVLRLNAFNESVAGISSTGGAGIVENGGATASVFTTSFTSGIQTFTGVIQDGGVGALSLTKDGAGTQIISGENTFSGGTVVNNGVLLANSSGALGTGGVTVNGGSLGGTGGVIAGGVTLAGGTLAPGASIGTLTVGSVAGAGTLGIEYDSTTQSIDLLNVTGSLDVSTIGLSFSDLGGGSLSNPSYVFATYGSLLGTFSSVSSLPTGYTLDYAFGGNNIAIVAVPEPSTLALLTVAIVGGGLYRRNRNAKKAAAQS